jgi:hypothetical protein
MNYFNSSRFLPFLSRSKLNILVALLALLFSCWLMNSTFAYNQGNFYISSRLWSDFGAHLPLIRSFSLGDNFPPQYPHFAHQPIQYHYGFYLLSGLLEKISIPIDVAVNAPSIIGFALLLWLIYLIAGKITTKPIAGLIAVVLFTFNGSLTFVDYFTEQGLSIESVMAIPTLTDFVNFGPWNGDHISAFWHLNIYTNQRHLGLSYALVLGMLWPIITNKISRTNRATTLAWFLVIVGVSIISPLIHKAIVPITVVVAACWACFHPRQLRYLLPIMGIMIIVSIPAYQHVTPFAEVLQLNPGYLAQGNTFIDWIHYWIWNAGAYLIVIPLAFIFLNRQSKALVAASLVLFAIANIFQMSTDMINNHKLINFTLILWAIVASNFILKLYKLKRVGMPLSALLMLIMTFSGVIDLAPISNDRLIPLADAAQSPTQQWIIQNTPKQAVFLSSHKFYNPASLAGRLLYFGYSYFPWSMGYDIAKRETFTREIFAPRTSFAQSCEMLIGEKIDYVIISSGPGEIGDTNVQVSSIVQSFKPIYNNESENHKIYSVAENCTRL